MELKPRIGGHHGGVRARSLSDPSTGREAPAGGVATIDVEPLGGGLRLVVADADVTVAGRVIRAGEHRDYPSSIDLKTLGQISAAGSLSPRARSMVSLATRALALVRSGHITPQGDANQAIWVERADKTRDEPDVDPSLASWYAVHLNSVATQGFGPAGVALGLSEAASQEFRGIASRDLSDWGAQVAARRQAGVRLALRLSEPRTPEGDWHVETCLVALTDPSMVVPLADIIDDRNLGRRRRADLQRLMEAEQARARQVMWPRWNPRQPWPLSTTSLIDFLDTRVETLAELGITTIAPAGLLHAAKLHRSAMVSTGSGLSLGTAAQLALTAQVEVAGVAVSREELAAAVAAKRELLRAGSGWVRVGTKEIQTALAFLQRAEKPVQAGELLTDGTFNQADLTLDADAPAWLTEGLSGTWTSTALEPVDVSAEVTAELRHYQHTGVAWLAWCERNHLGGVLADDMGLGKTLQILAAIALDHSGPTLVVCPPSIVTNWLREAAKFTPGLRVTGFHGSARGELAPHAADHDVVVTTYDTVRANAAEFASVEWLRCVLDEAGKIKNPNTKVAQAIRSIRATHRFAVTGTPVENHAGELWSIMAFANPGLLGPYTSFMSRFSNAALTDEETGEERSLSLAQAVSPFILRRHKTEPGVADDLPPKTVVRDDCALTTEQVTAYEAAAAEMLERVDRSDKAHRRIAVIDGISKLKQICNHPATLIDDPDAPLEGRSGKVDRLTELLAEIIEEGAAAVVFSQYPTFLACIAATLDRQLGLTSDVLSGKTSRHQRDLMVDRFSAPDGPPVLYSSLKAGGIGLNLVRASHIIHFDLWWNPAAQDQASDRAWRIGQDQPVIVHNLVCPGTLEERIEKLLETKRSIADKIVGTNTGGSVASLDDDALTALVNLSKPDVLET